MMGMSSWGQLGGAALGGISGGKSKSSGGLPGFVRKGGKQGIDMIRQAGARPLDEQVAGFNDDQKNAFTAVRAYQGWLQPEMEAAQRTAQTLSGGVTPDMIAKFYNPYQRDVIDASMADIEEYRARRQAAASADMEAARAYGGSREGVYRANIDGEYDRTGAGIIAGLRSQGFDTAAQLATQGVGMQIAGNAQLADLIERRRRAQAGDTAALAGIGDAQQQLEQYRMDNPLRIGGLMASNAASFAGAQRPTSSGGGVDGVMKGILGGMDFAKQMGG